jgi:ligand-binding sensor domain-containing protein
VKHIPAHFSRKIWATALLVVAGAAVLLMAGSAVWEASRAVRDASATLAADSQIPFSQIQLDLMPASGIESISAPSVFADAALFEGHLFLAGPEGIVEYDADGKLLQRYRVGLELPAAPVTKLAAGIAAGQSGPALYVATAGEGLLILRAGSKTFMQVRAEEESFRDLTALLPLRTGRVLLGTEQRGVLSYDGTNLSLLHRSFGDSHITTLQGDETSLWIGTLAQGVWHWSGGRLDRFGEAEGLPDPQVVSLAQGENSVFVGTPLGVAEFRDGRFERKLAEGIFARDLAASEEVLTVAALDEGVLDVPLVTRRVRPPRLTGEQAPNLADVRRLLQLDERLYALASGGLYEQDRGQGGWRVVLEPEGALLTDRNIAALSMDPAGRLWVGYFDRGLDIVDLAGRRATHIEDQHVFCVNRIVHDTQRSLTGVATANGLVMFDASGKQQQVLGRDEGLVANHVTDLVFRPDGMTVATPAGLTFIDAGGIRSLYAFHGLVNNHVYALASVGERLMAGTLGGLSVLDAGVVRTGYTTGNSELKHNWITAIVPLGHEWLVGTYGAGIVKLDAAGRWLQLPGASGPFEINPNAMTASAGYVYAGSLGRGLYVYNPATDRWKIFTAGLPSLNVTAVAAGGGYLYIGTDNGLVRIAEESLRAL